MRLSVPLGLALAAVLVLPGARADARDVLAPGLVYTRTVQPGPVIAHILRLDRYPARRTGPDGPRFEVEAVRGRPFATGRTPLSRLVRSRTRSGVMAGLNGDYFSWSGVPSGLLLGAGGLARDPAVSRSSAVIDAPGALHVLRLWMEGAYRTPGGPERRVHAVNRLPRGDRPETLLHTDDFGPRTPPAPGATSLILARPPGAPLMGGMRTRVVAVGRGGGVPTGPGTVVLTENDPGRAAALAAEVRPGDAVALRIDVPGLPPAAETGIGGGPRLVADGRPSVGVDEGFTSGQLGGRTARSAVGQRRDGSLLLVSVEDGRSGPSRGVTTAEMAELMAGLGAITAMGLDSGGSAGLSIRGARSPTAGPDGERPISTALVVRYNGVRLPVPDPQRVSPNGDGVDESTRILYRVNRRSAVRADLLNRRGARVARLGAGWRAAGAHEARLPGGLRDGRYRVRVVARGADDRTATRFARNLTVDRTLGHLRLGGRSRQALVAFRLSRPADVSVVLDDGRGRPRRAVADRRLGRGNRGIRISTPPGVTRVRVYAKTPLGTSDLTGRVRVRR